MFECQQGLADRDEKKSGDRGGDQRNIMSRKCVISHQSGTCTTNKNIDSMKGREAVAKGPVKVTLSNNVRG